MSDTEEVLWLWRIGNPGLRGGYVRAVSPSAAREKIRQRYGYTAVNVRPARYMETPARHWIWESRQGVDGTVSARTPEHAAELVHEELGYTVTRLHPLD